jgi:hypothetical protein
MKINPFELKQQIANLLLVFPELADDEDARLMSMESETDLKEVLTVVLDDIMEAKAMQVAIDERIKDLKARGDRFYQREQGWRKLAHDLMNAASLRKLQLPTATLSVRNGQPSVTIIDQAFLPENFWRVKREPNISAIKDALKSGTEVPGAVLNNGSETLAVLTK